MIHVASPLKSFWESEYPHLSREQQNSLNGWLMGESDKQLERNGVKVTHSLSCRYQILKQHYLGVAPIQAYSYLFNHLGSMLVRYPQIRTWIISSRQHRKVLVTTLQAMIEEVLHLDPYLQQQQAEIAQLTEDLPWRNALLLTAIEEYCLCPLDNHPLVVHLLYHFLRHSRRQQMTPQQKDLLALISETIHGCVLAVANG